MRSTRSIRSMALALALAAVAPMAAAAPFEALPEDATLKTMLARWAQASGWRLEIDEHPADLSFTHRRHQPIPEDERAAARESLNAFLASSKDFPEAIERMMSATPIDAWGPYAPPLICLWGGSRSYSIDSPTPGRHCGSPSHPGAPELLAR